MDNAPSAKLLHQLLMGSTVCAAADQQAVGDEPKGRDVDLASPLVDQLDELAIDVGIFAGPVVVLRTGRR